MRSGTSSTMRWTRRARLSAFPDASCAAERFPRPTIVVEPGRAISARAGITLYRVLWVQSQPGGRTIVVVDGGSERQPAGRAL